VEAFFRLDFLRSAARLLFVSRQKVRELEAQYANHPHNSRGDTSKGNDIYFKKLKNGCTETN